MRVFALSDPHLSLGTPGKEMDRFGSHWVRHAERMAAAWDERVGADDLVLVPGDISWARDLAGAAPDLQWLAARPGTKLILKGNHEHWWPESRRKLEAALPPGVRAVQGDALRVGDVAVCGTRLWDAPGVSYHDVIAWEGEPISRELTDADAAASLKVYQRELGRLDRALAALDRSAPLRLAMLHYPPVGPAPAGGALPGNELTARFAAAGVQHVVFGHIHALRADARPRIGGVLDGVHYHLAAVDFIGFKPLLLAGT
ncbi:MAG TPA: metallophosphoesterase [Planctomycetota bacterium]|nr:metallophosphoesterase [Planctomycetota bacterium]